MSTLLIISDMSVEFGALLGEGLGPVSISLFLGDVHCRHLGVVAEGILHD